MIRLIVNPNSGTGMGKNEISRIHRNLLNRADRPVEMEISKNADHLRELVAETRTPKWDQLVIVGGDGTVNMALQELMKLPVEARPKLALSREGTGADYARGMGLGKSDWMGVVARHSEKVVDVGIVQSEGSESRYFLNMMSCGITAEIAHAKNRIPLKIPGLFKYIVPTVKALPNLRSTQIRVETDEKIFDERLLAVCICKGTYVGGGMRMGGGVELDDGLFDIKLIRPMSPTRALFCLPKLYLGDFSNIPEIETLKAASVRISSSGAISSETEGEGFELKNAQVQVVPRALRICFPLN